MRRIIATCLALILAVASILIFPTGNDSGVIELLLDAQKVQAAERTFDAVDITRNESPEITSLSIGRALYGQTPRNGYVLAPTMFGLAGIDTKSPFVLRTPTGYDELPLITIDGQSQPTVTREDGSTFIVTPAIPLTSNSVYVFRLAHDDGDITWAFQTAIRFEITSVFPRNQATNVPVRTGIEIEFSLGDNINIEDHFSIYPHVAGSFTHRDSTAIFMPTFPLLHGQIYTVTISAGISLPNASEVIAADRVFSFETAPTPVLPQQLTHRTAGNIHFSNRHLEFPSFAEPSVNFWLNYNRDEGRPTVNMAIYRIDDQAQAIAATTRLAGVPSWSSLPNVHSFVDTSDLTRVYSSRIGNRVVNNSWWRWNETFDISTSLPPGFYVVNATTDYSHNQMILQITDLAVQVIVDNNMVLVWVNDMHTGLPTVGAQVYDPITGRTYEVSTYGIAVVERRLLTGEYLIITAADGKQSVVFAHSAAFQSFNRSWDSWDWDMDWDWSPRSNAPANDDYWTALQLDRTLFQRSDTVSLWGFVQNRNQYENITHVTATLTERNWWASGRDTLHMQNIAVEYGAYHDEINLPHLDPGSYEIAVYHGDILLNTMFFTVMDYVKPPYQLIVSSDINAIFAGEEVNFTARTEFFEGTPVPDLYISYHFAGWGLRTPGTGQEQTNLEGVVEISATPTASQADVQGERSLRFMAEATLPEIGWVNESASVRVFVNDINVRPWATRDGRDGTLTVNVNDITLDRINDGTATHRSDFLCEPTADQRISVEIVEIYWEQVREGESYCHATRQVVPWYRHERRERSIERFDITTNEDGVATKDFQVPNRENASYRARLTTIDGNGRTIVHYAFIGRDFTSFFRNANNDSLFLYGANEDGYDVGDEVELTIMRGTEAVTQGNFLFVVVQNGILCYHIGTNPLSFTFDERHVPNAQVFAFHFNGHTYNSGWGMSQRLRFNTESRLLDISIDICQEAYRPGDMATFTITTTDMDGNPKPAHVNISLVDEALFALMDYNVNTLAMLYRNVSDNLRFSMATHRTFVSDGIEDEADEDEFHPGDMLADDAAPVAAEATQIPGPFFSSGSLGDADDTTHIRERFEDTAIFASLQTNNQGVGTFTFQMPDNITSWRITASAISNDLYAGNTVQNINVTQPMFLHYTLNSTFLVGDRPYVGVNVYGTSLTGGEQVTFEVWREDAPNDVRTATGVSFARVNIPLWEMTTEGSGAIIVRASVAGHSDAVLHPYTVLNSHRQVDTAFFYDVTTNTVFDVNPGGLTNITFTDHGRGQFLRDLFSLRNAWWGSGARIEGYVARREATRLIGTHFSDVRMFGPIGNFDVLEYQTESGGIAILPYAEADLATTVMLLPFIKDDVNLAALTAYLQNIFDTSPTDNKMLALYGLALLGEPVLLDLHRYAALTDLSVRNTAYVALGLAALGETQTARYLYTNRIAPHIQSIAPYYRVNVGANRAEILDATSAVSLLAAQLGMPESLGLHNYARRYRFDASNRNDALVMGMERLAFIAHEIENHTDVAASIAYTLFGETITRDLGPGRQFTLRIPAQNMHEFNIISTTGEVGAVSIVRTPLEEMEAVENDITIRRQFFVAGTNTPTTTFEQGDLVRVQITIDYSARSLTGSYVVTDFLPAGLVHVPNSARFGDRYSRVGWWAHARTEGQRITFFDFNSRFDRIHTYFYYARVINPGTFMAEGTFVQSVGAREYMTVGENAVLTINP
ncbi:MAG: Ig-like domain-containing protein [Defluviitaleaceae bacterium]|nr:Ig-like domain-containing protein [Defluviitaleaceae bacterium]